MITIDLLDICQNCRDLEPEKTNEFDTWGSNDIEHYCTLTCEHIDRCRRLMKHIQKEVEKDGD